MRRTLVGLLAVAILDTAAHAASSQTHLQAEGLRCEYLASPLGIDVVKPRLSWRLPTGPRGRRQSAYQLLVASKPENLRENKGDLWDTGRVNSDRCTFVPYAGRPLPSGARCHWKVRVWDERGRPSRWSNPAMWSMGLLRGSDWHGLWIGQGLPAGVKKGTPLPFPWLRKTFALKQKPRQATASVNALGYYELYVNGRKVDDHVLSPAVSDYSRRSLYVTHDVTNYLVPGVNCVALWLGRGWYVRGHPGVIHDGPLVRAQVQVALTDGTTVRIGTDPTWKVRESPISPLGRGLAFGDYGGERYDARLEMTDWKTARLDDSSWKAAALFEPSKVVTAAQMVEPNRIMETIRPVKVQESSPGVYLFDMGRNLTGWFQLRLRGSLPAGTTVKLEYADAPPSVTRFRSYNQRDEFVTSGKAPQLFRSRFNYHGFRWVRVTGLQHAPSLTDALGNLIHTAYEPAGEFECSSELLNRIYRMTTWTYRCLTLGGYVVDCPTRERLGYGGDAGTSMETGMLNFHAGALYNKWSADWRAAQHPETGDLPFTAPHYQDQGGGGPMWSGFVVTLPWQMYLQYGDRQILKTSYPTIRKWLAYLESETVDHLLQSHRSYAMHLPQWTFLGDWLAPRRPEQTPRRRSSDPESIRFINNCHYLYQLQLAGKIAALLGQKGDAASYQAKAVTLGRLLHARFYDSESGSYATGEQPYLAFPLLVGVVPPGLRAPLMRKLEETIRITDQGHINAGMHGTYFLLKYLTEQDRSDLIYEMVSKTDYPGWGYMLEHGATTSWEDWSGNDSHIHNTFISIGSWFIQGIGGIRADEQSPGFRQFHIRPALVGNVTFARTRYQSPYGTIISNWRVANGVLHLDVTIPAGTTAQVYVPTSSPASVMEGGRPVTRSPGVRSMMAEGGKAVYRVTSGRYSFTAKLP